MRYNIPWDKRIYCDNLDVVVVTVYTLKGIEVPYYDIVDPCYSGTHTHTTWRMAMDIGDTSIWNTICKSSCGHKVFVQTRSPCLFVNHHSLFP